MKAAPLKAHYHGRQIRLDEPYELPAAAKLEVRVAPGEAARAAERQAWHELARRSLARASGRNEADHSDCLGEAPPPE